MSSKVLTEKQAAALSLFVGYGPMRPGVFARRMWPDAEGWQITAKCGPYGVCRGGGMRLAAGGWLGKLAAKGFLRGDPDGYAITDTGRKTLKEYING